LYRVWLRRVIQSVWGRVLIIYVAISLVLALYQLYEALPFLRAWIGPTMRWVRERLGQVAVYALSFLQQFNWLTIGIVVPLRNIGNFFLQLATPLFQGVKSVLMLFAPLVKGFYSGIVVIVSSFGKFGSAIGHGVVTMIRTVALLFRMFGSALRSVFHFDAIWFMFQGLWYNIRTVGHGIAVLFSYLAPPPGLYRFFRSCSSVISGAVRPNINRVVNARQFLQEHIKKLVNLVTQAVSELRIHRGKQLAESKKNNHSPGLSPASPPLAPVRNKTPTIRTPSPTRMTLRARRREACASSTVKALRL